MYTILSSRTASCAALLAALATTSHAQTTAFIKIADTADPTFSGFNVATMGGNGTVGFLASRRAGGEGVYTGSGGATTTILDTTSPLLTGSAFSNDVLINNAGTVVARTFATSGGVSGLYSATAGTAGVVRLAGSTNPAFQAFDSVALNNVGAVAFGARNSAGVSGVYTAQAGVANTATTIADGSGAFSQAFSALINDTGTVGFSAEIRAGGRGTFTANGGVVRTIIDSTNPNYSSPLTSRINASGSVALLAFRQAGGQGIYRGDGVTVTTIADTDSPTFSNFTLFSGFNNAGNAAFLASMDAGGNGIFTVSNGVVKTIATNGGFNSAPALNNVGTVAYSTNQGGRSDIFAALSGTASPVRVIGTGDSLFGSTVTGVGFGFRGLNDSNQIAFGYSLADGRSGVAIAGVASPVIVPEAGTLALSVIGLISTLVLRKRK